MAAKPPHKAKPSKGGMRKYYRNRIGRKPGNPTKYRAEGRREKNKARRAARRARKCPSIDRKCSWFGHDALIRRKAWFESMVVYWGRGRGFKSRHSL